MDKDKIIDYVMNTPGNTNKMVLEGMLGDTDGVKLPEISEEDEGKVLTVIDGKWDKGVASSDKGYECTEEHTLLTDESVTTVAGEHGNEGRLAYSTPIAADKIRVTFNGVEYSFDKESPNPSLISYGDMDAQTGPDFSNYPFAILSTPGGNTLITETAGTYQVKIETVGESVETSECFEKAVKKATDVGYECTEPLYSGTVETTTEVTTPVGSVKYGEVPYGFTEMPPETLYIEFDGVTYTVPRIINGGVAYYGGSPDVSPSDWPYPFSFTPQFGSSALTVPATSSDTHTLKIYDGSPSVTTSGCFKKAVNSLSPFFKVTKGMNASEVIDAYNSGEKLLYVFNPTSYDEGYYFLTYYDEVDESFRLTPTASNTNVTINNGTIDINATVA